MRSGKESLVFFGHLRVAPNRPQDTQDVKSVLLSWHNAAVSLARWDISLTHMKCVWKVHCAEMKWVWSLKSAWGLRWSWPVCLVSLKEFGSLQVIPSLSRMFWTNMSCIDKYIVRKVSWVLIQCDILDEVGLFAQYHWRIRAVVKTFQAYQELF